MVKNVLSEGECLWRKGREHAMAEETYSAAECVRIVKEMLK